MDHVSNIIIQKLEVMAVAGDSDLVISKRKAVSTLLPHAIFLEQNGQQRMIDAIFRAARTSGSSIFVWRHTTLYISRLFESRSPTSLNRVIALTSPYVPWDGTLNGTIAVARWAAAVSAIPYTEEVGQSVVDALFQIATISLLRPRIPIEIWRWIKEHPSLPPVYHGEAKGGELTTLLLIHRLGDVELLKSYFILVWTDRWTPDGAATGMEKFLREDFGGIEMENHRRDLIERLDYVLERLDQRLEDCEENLRRDLETAKQTYTGFKAVLLQVSRQ